ncbi:DUF2497 domain-containing protein [Hirschia baltica]|uniref:Pole-organizing protein PopZ n=1 Tax=Hirschia baltica (strain ATCC 49814 / DSM 5838 / IFAM 1418) TaxID=582402 RepID=C6XIS5_HIRBI|nr:DUF2497 domain-containing protein [Hirschia baltica]ACT59020.1 conserved hypothetical protein [Hirschia baltica ATCC 49814]
MSAEEAASEPTMEEILASIRKIISEDDEPAPTEADASAADVLDLSDAEQIDDDPVDLDLTEPEEEFDMAAAMEEMAEDVEPQSDVVVVDADEWAEDEPEVDMADWGIEEEPEPEPVAEPVAAAPEPAPKPAPAPEPESEGLVAAATADATAGQLGKLMGSMMLSQGTTIEDLVREMLKPMLKEWLDGNLPQLVEQEVQKELQRISRMAR